MIVISDTSPLRYLALIGCLDILPVMFGQVICPSKVRQECCHPRAPEKLRSLFSSAPEWLLVVDDVPVSPALAAALDPGECVAIELAQQHAESLLLMDERLGRRMAESLGLRVAGTINILAKAGVLGLLDYSSTVKILRETTNFRIHDDIVTLAWELAHQDAP